MFGLASRSLEYTRGLTKHAIPHELPSVAAYFFVKFKLSFYRLFG